jgi:hypothetical protein
MMLQKNPNLTPLEIYSILQNTAIDMNTAGFDYDSGFGLIDALGAVNAVAPTKPTPSPIQPAPAPTKLTPTALAPTAVCYFDGEPCENPEFACSCKC